MRSEPEPFESDFHISLELQDLAESESLPGLVWWGSGLSWNLPGRLVWWGSRSSSNLPDSDSPFSMWRMSRECSKKEARRSESLFWKSESPKKRKNKHLKFVYNDHPRDPKILRFSEMVFIYRVLLKNSIHFGWWGFRQVIVDRWSLFRDGC